MFMLMLFCYLHTARMGFQIIQSRFLPVHWLWILLSEAGLQFQMKPDFRCWLWALLCAQSLCWFCMLEKQTIRCSLLRESNMSLGPAMTQLVETWFCVICEMIFWTLFWCQYSYLLQTVTAVTHLVRLDVTRTFNKYAWVIMQIGLGVKIVYTFKYPVYTCTMVLLLKADWIHVQYLAFKESLSLFLYSFTNVFTLCCLYVYTVVVFLHCASVIVVMFVHCSY